MNPAIESEQYAVTVPRYLPWLVVFSASLFFFYEFIQMQMFNTISHDLLSDFKISATTLGYVASGYFLADVMFLFPAGMLIDRFSTKRMILIGMGISVLTTAIFGLSHSIWLVGICHFAAGFGAAFCLLSCVRLASRWFPARMMAMIVGLVVTVGFFGGMVAQTPLAWVVAKWGWREAVEIVAGLGLLIIGIIFSCVRDYPPGKEGFFAAQKHQLKNLGLKGTMKAALSNTQNWFCGFYTSFLDVPLMLLGGLWGSLYLTTVRHLSLMQASYVTSMIFFGSMIGCPLIGALSDYLALRKMPMVVFAALSLPLMLIIVYVPDLSLTSLLLLFFGLGLFTAAQTIGYPVISESNPKMMTSSAMGVSSVLIMGSPMVFEPIFGWLMDKSWDGKMIEGVHVYSAQTYHHSMLLLTAVLAVSLIASFFIRETYAKENPN